MTTDYNIKNYIANRKSTHHILILAQYDYIMCLYITYTPNYRI